MIDIVVLNVGVSQQLFDARAFSDTLSTLYDESHSHFRVSNCFIAECLLVFAIGRLLQARWDDDSEAPGQDFFNEALKRIPNMTHLREQGTLGIELMGLCALYLQVSDRKDEAYHKWAREKKKMEEEHERKEAQEMDRMEAELKKARAAL